MSFLFKSFPEEENLVMHVCVFVFMCLYIYVGILVSFGLLFFIFERVSTLLRYMILFAITTILEQILYK